MAVNLRPAAAAAAAACSSSTRVSKPVAFSSPSSGGSSPSSSGAGSGGRRAVATRAVAAAEAASRRRALLGLGLAAAGAATLLPPPPPALALCSDLDTAEAGDACRQQELAADAAAGKKASYSQLSSAGPSAKRVAPNVPVSELDAEYARGTRELAAAIDAYLAADVYDKARPALIKALKADSSAWVAKYARGGSARSQSARKMYIAADAVLGYLASNGLAPMPANKAKVVADTTATALNFLAEGR